jgi:hypothetical protein
MAQLHMNSEAYPGGKSSAFNIVLNMGDFTLAKPGIGTLFKNPA